MKLLILGSDTCVGHALAEFSAENRLACVSIIEKDLARNGPELTRLVQSHHPDFVVNTLSLDIEKSRELSIVVGQLDIPLVQLSNNLMFELSDDQIYSENDEANADQKLLLVEQQLAENARRHLILRTGWLLGHENDLMQILLKKMQQQATLTLPDFPKISPTPADDVARVLVAMMQQCHCDERLWGTYHYAAVEAISAKDFAQVLSTEAGQFEPLKLENLQTGSSELSQLEGGLMSCKHILHVFGIKPRPWRTAMSLMLKQHYMEF